MSLSPLQEQDTDPSHMLPEHTRERPKGGSGAIIGICIIVLLLIVGGLYFWGAKLSEEAGSPLPLIPGDSSSQNS